MTERNLFLARHNGQETTAKKYGKRWMIGGDFGATGSISILCWHKAAENGGGFWAWHTLKGCFLKYEDNATDDEIAKHIALNKKYAAAVLESCKAGLPYLHHKFATVNNPIDKEYYKKRIQETNKIILENS